MDYTDGDLTACAENKENGMVYAVCSGGGYGSL